MASDGAGAHTGARVSELALVMAASDERLRTIGNLE